MPKEDIQKKPEYITVEDAISLFNSILLNYSGVFRVQSGLLQSLKLRLTNLGTDPTIGEVGDLVVVGGKLKICTVASLTAPTWVIVGTQS